MSERPILITGACGEVGQALVQQLASDGYDQLVTMDLRPLPDHLVGLAHHFEGDLLDDDLRAQIFDTYEIETIYHLGALLSTTSEHKPALAQRVNVEGTVGLLQTAAALSQKRGRPVKFIFPSSIAVYGMPDRHSKRLYRRVREWEWTQPRTMYGVNKLSCEGLGDYYSRHYQQLADETPVMVDFRAVRFPGLISAFTVPSGGTSDYAPEMLHAAAQGRPYAGFVRPDTQIPFMAMPDAVTALLQLAAAPRTDLSQTVYNVRAFSLSAAQVAERVREAFPTAEITFDRPDAQRQKIVDGWPADLDDSAAQRDWAWSPVYDADRAFADYLLPNIRWTK